ncbi:MAG: holo-ACP synthase, partial [Anaerolineae bacterium]
VAAKEAVGNALGSGIGDVRWVEVDVLRGDRGEPRLVLHGAAAQLAAKLGLSEWSVSLTHTERDALAFVVAMGYTGVRTDESGANE